MTKNQLAHRAEQMEAVRHDFHTKVWTKTVTNKNYAAYIEAWNKYRKSKI